jgi:hypothetical protein
MSGKKVIREDKYINHSQIRERRYNDILELIGYQSGHISTLSLIEVPKRPEVSASKQSSNISTDIVIVCA